MKKKSSPGSVRSPGCRSLVCLFLLLTASSARSWAWQEPAQPEPTQGSSAQVAPTPEYRQNRKIQPYAVISGTVFDARQMSVYGVKVKIRRSDEKKAKWELYSDHSGEFAQRVPPGPADYVVWAEVKTAKGQARPEKTVHIYGDELRTVFLHLDQPETSESKPQ